MWIAFGALIGIILIGKALTGTEKAALVWSIFATSASPNTRLLVGSLIFFVIWLPLVLFLGKTGFLGLLWDIGGKVLALPFVILGALFHYVF